MVFGVIIEEVWGPDIPDGGQQEEVSLKEELEAALGATCVCVCECLFAQSSPIDTMDCRPPDSSVHVIFQARILEWIAISHSTRSWVNKEN